MRLESRPDQAAWLCNCSRGAGRSRHLLSHGHKAQLGGTYGTLVLWDLDKQAEIRKLEGTGGDIAALAFSPSAAFALSGSADKTVRLWDVSSGRQMTSTEASGDYVSSVAFSADEKSALFGSSDGSVALWQLE